MGCVLASLSSVHMDKMNYENPLEFDPWRWKIEILKRLQREAFSDIMKIRDRQDKVERILTFYKSSKGIPFEEASTCVKGKVDVLGALFIMDSVNEQKLDAIQNSCIRTGIDARLSFQTAIREKDILVAEFVASEKNQGNVERAITEYFEFGPPPSEST